MGVTGEVILQSAGGEILVGEAYEDALSKALKEAESDADVKSDIGKGTIGGGVIRPMAIAIVDVLGEVTSAPQELAQIRELVAIGPGNPGGTTVRLSKSSALIGRMDALEVDDAVDRALEEGRGTIVAVEEMAEDVVASVARHLGRDVTVVQVRA